MPSCCSSFRKTEIGGYGSRLKAGTTIVLRAELTPPPSAARPPPSSFRFDQRSRHNNTFSRRIAPEACKSFSHLSQREGAGNAGCALHPRSRVQNCAGSAHEHTGSAEAIRHSLRNGLTAYAVISSATNSSCHRRRRIEGLSGPGWTNAPPPT
jgi:hypothetical protein